MGSPAKQAVMQSRNEQNKQVQLALDPMDKTKIAAPNQETLLAMRQAAARGSKGSPRPAPTQAPMAARQQAIRGKAGRLRR